MSKHKSIKFIDNKMKKIKSKEDPDEKKTKSELLDAGNVLNSGEFLSSQAKPKILIQRVFHQTEKGTVEVELDYVIANSEEEITKHVYGGLFRNKYYNYSPESYCHKHAPDLFEYNDETLVKIGDKFDSLECFRLYVNERAKDWKYYLKCGDSHRKNGKDSFVFQCVFAKQRSKVSTAKGLRKRTFAVPKCDCPCRVILKPVPFDAKDMTVIYVCNHHDHPLTDEYFNKLQHGRRVHPSVKEELMDLLSLEVDREVVSKYFESLTGNKMHCTYYTNMLNSMKKKKIERQFSLEKLKEMSKKIEKIKEELGLNYEEENVDNDLIPDDSINKGKASIVAEVLNVLKTVSAPKKPRMRHSNAELVSSPKRKRHKKQQDLFEDVIPSPQEVHNTSRLEIRLQELKHDRETLQSIKHLQDSVRCETEKNPWANDQVVVIDSNEISETNIVINSQEDLPITTPEIEPQTIVIEDPINDDSYVENQDIVYENEITVMETEENCPDTVVQVVEDEVINLNEDNVTFCIQYDEEDLGNLQEQYVLVFDDSEDVQIKATELATVSITTENKNELTQADIRAEEVIPTTVSEESNYENQETHDVPLYHSDEICVIDQSQCEETETENPNTEESVVCEVIQTNDKKILPSKEVVDSIILMKPPKGKPRSNSNKKGNNRLDKDTMYKKFRRKNKNGTKRILDVNTEDILNKYLQELEDDSCYMLVVDDEEDELSKECCESVISETPEYLEIDYADSEAESVSSRFSCKTSRYKREKIDLEIAVHRLRNQKMALEHDIKKLKETKDDLIVNITKVENGSELMDEL